MTGSVPDVRPELWSAAVATAPLHLARGVQTKVLDAVAAGLPCVITSAVVGGLPDQIKAACPIADSPEAFAARIVDCLRRTPEERRAMAHIDLSDLAMGTPACAPAVADQRGGRSDQGNLNT